MPASVQYGDNDNLILINLIKDAEWEALDEGVSDSFVNRDERAGLLGNRT
jgi:hypothetical protein